MAQSDGGPAFPGPYTCGDASSRGMSLRDYFAARVIAALLRGYTPVSTPGRVNMAETAYMLADAMLKARGEGQDG